MRTAVRVRVRQREIHREERSGAALGQVLGHAVERHRERVVADTARGVRRPHGDDVDAWLQRDVWNHPVGGGGAGRSAAAAIAVPRDGGDAWRDRPGKREEMRARRQHGVAGGRVDRERQRRGPGDRRARERTRRDDDRPAVEASLVSTNAVADQHRPVATRTESIETRQLPDRIELVERRYPASGERGKVIGRVPQTVRRRVVDHGVDEVVTASAVGEQAWQEDQIGAVAVRGPQEHGQVADERVLEVVHAEIQVRDLEVVAPPRGADSPAGRCREWPIRECGSCERHRCAGARSQCPRAA